jgi:hypothetical protein
VNYECSVCVCFLDHSVYSRWTLKTECAWAGIVPSITSLTTVWIIGVQLLALRLYLGWGLPSLLSICAERDLSPPSSTKIRNMCGIFWFSYKQCLFFFLKKVLELIQRPKIQSETGVSYTDPTFCNSVRGCFLQRKNFRRCSITKILLPISLHSTVWGQFYSLPLNICSFLFVSLNHASGSIF